jgi:hypothetical protein
MPDETLLQQLIFPGTWLLGLLHGLLRHAATRLLPAFIGSMMMLLVLLIAAGINQLGDWVRWFGLALIILPVAVLFFMAGQILGVWLGRKIRNL